LVIYLSLKSPTDLFEEAYGIDTPEKKSPIFRKQGQGVYRIFSLRKDCWC